MRQGGGESAYSSMRVDAAALADALAAALLDAPRHGGSRNEGANGEDEAQAVAVAGAT